MALEIKKEEMDQAWIDREKSDKLYKYLYDIAQYQVSRKGISFNDRWDYVQFAVMKCFKHQNSFNVKRGAAYSFFWKQIALAIAYKSRKEARRSNKVKTFYVDQEKILDWIEGEQHRDGTPFNNIVDDEETALIKAAYRRYNLMHKGKTLKPTRDTIITVFKWIEKRDPGFLDKFTTLKSIFKNWMQEVKA
jgi:DNA-directed RNA polymerase specialized sigma24 family protein